MLYSTSDKNLKNIPYTDEELVALYLETGQNYYFGLLYVKCSNAVYRQCLFLIKDRGLAQDLTHDVFIKLLTVLPSFKGKARFSTWLSSVTHNHCMDQFRLRRHKAEDSIDERMDIADELDLINYLENDSFDMANLKNALTNLPSQEQAILLMRYTDDVSIQDIADEFKINKSAVKMRLMRSRKKLRTSCSASYYKY